MRIRIGYELTYESPQPVPMLLMLSVHPGRVADLEIRDAIVTEPNLPITYYRDGFGNTCGRIVAPAGRLRLTSEAVIRDSGRPDAVAPAAGQHAIADLPDDSLVFLLGSRYCETDRLSDTAWALFGATPPGWPRVQAICDFVHDRLAFGYEHARPTRSALDAYSEGRGVCRDFAHLAVTLCRCMSIPARYCTGYLGDIGVPPDVAPMDYSAWFEAWLGGGWYTFDARHNRPRIGRILIARGRDAADVAITTSFGPTLLTGFRVVTDELPG